LPKTQDTDLTGPSLVGILSSVLAPHFKFEKNKTMFKENQHTASFIMPCSTASFLLLAVVAVGVGPATIAVVDVAGGGHEELQAARSQLLCLYPRSLELASTDFKNT
jgi:hypothetical protein